MTFIQNADADILFSSINSEELYQKKVSLQRELLHSSFLNNDFQTLKERLKVLEETNNTFHICPIERVDFNLYKNQHSISSPEVNRHSLKAYEELEIEYADFDFGTGY
mgnify:CR=1 FL=1